MFQRIFFLSSVVLFCIQSHSIAGQISLTCSNIVETFTSTSFDAKEIKGVKLEGMNGVIELKQPLENTAIKKNSLVYTSEETFNTMLADRCVLVVEIFKNILTEKAGTKVPAVIKTLCSDRSSSQDNVECVIESASH